MKYLIILALLLSACSKDEEQEGLKINEPIITSHDGNRQGKFNDFKSYNRSQLHIEDSISFENTAVHFKLKMQTHCHTEELQSDEHILYADKPKELKIKNLLPIEVIDWMANEQKINCDFLFVASDSEGAEHFFSWEKMDVTYNFTKQALLFTPELNEVQDNAVINYQDLEGYQTLSPEYRHINLDCDELKSEKIDSLILKLNADLLKKMKEKNFRCRLIEVNKWGGLENYSAVFYISPGSEALVVRAITPKKTFSFSDRHHEISSWEIYNPSNIAKNISIDANFTYFDSIYYNIGFDVQGKVGPANAAETPLSVSLSHDKIFMLEPAQSVIVSLYLSRRERCLRETNGLLAKPKVTDELRLNEYRHSTTESDPVQILQSIDLQLGSEIWVPGIAYRHYYRQESTKHTTPHPSSASRTHYGKCH